MTLAFTSVITEGAHHAMEPKLYVASRGNYALLFITVTSIP
jgi:hypothetical protein